MKALDVYLSYEPAGKIKMLQTGEVGFRYDDGYGGPNLSVSMRRQEGAVFRGEHVGQWFSNLLPDDYRVRDGMASNMGYRGTNTFMLLADYGIDLPGAVSVLPEGEEPDLQAMRYRPTDEREIARRLRKLIEADSNGSRRTWLRGGERWSLAGAQTKIALHEFGGTYYECLGGAPTTVIVKPDAANMALQSLCECVSMRTAQRCGIPAAQAEFATFDGVDAICVRRYDRVARDEGAVALFHQEDINQSLGIDPRFKYPSEGGASASGCVKVLQRHASAGSVPMFLKYLAFNYAIGNTDAHGKNYSLLHISADDVELAPLYDACSVLPFIAPGESYDLAMPLGNRKRLGTVSRTALARFAKACDLDPRMVVDVFRQTASDVMGNISAAVDDFAQCGRADELAAILVPRVTTLCESIIRTLGPNVVAPRIPDQYAFLTKNDPGGAPRG